MNYRMDYGLDMSLQEFLICSFIHVHLVTVVVSKILALVPTYVHPFTPVVFLICSASVTEKVFVLSLLCFDVFQQYDYNNNILGILCGSCKNNYGVSVLLNRCTSCSDAFGTLVGVLGI